MLSFIYIKGSLLQYLIYFIAWSSSHFSFELSYHLLFIYFVLSSLQSPQLEGLKARHGKEQDYQEVRELKEQIQMMRRQLEARMEEDEVRPDTPDTPIDEQPPKSPQIVLQESPKTEHPPSREYEQLQFDVRAVLGSLLLLS